MKFCLVDRIDELVVGRSIRTIKQVSLAEEYLQDHFPGFAVLPGVMMVEAMTQSCAWLLRASEEFQHSLITLQQARAVKFNNFLKPGDTLEVNATWKKEDGKLVSFVAAGTVRGESAVSAKLTLQRCNLAETTPELAENDARMNQAMKELFEQIRPQDG